MTEMSADLCIVGGAGAGLAAAVSAKEAGTKKVVLLEKMKKTGGCTRLAAGMFSVESPAQKRLGLHYTADECFIEHMDMSGWECDAKLVRKWMRNTGNITRWLEEKGCFFDRVVTFAAGKRLYHMMEKSTGNAIVNQLTRACEDNGVEILLNARAENVEGMSQEESTEWLDDIREDIRSEEEAGKVKIMNTLDEVAEYIGAKPETLKNESRYIIPTVKTSTMMNSLKILSFFSQ